ncbi:hypothetical protein CDD83_9897 [Cordyceps sp. RAO-2017]|nr:hypothetical protein CDD83_9897 [Cordyceps sp. RAO-2017]
MRGTGSGEGSGRPAGPSTPASRPAAPSLARDQRSGTEPTRPRAGRPGGRVTVAGNTRRRPRRPGSGPHAAPPLDPVPMPYMGPITTTALGMASSAPPGCATGTRPRIPGLGRPAVPSSRHRLGRSPTGFQSCSWDEPERARGRESQGLRRKKERCKKKMGGGAGRWSHEALFLYLAQAGQWPRPAPAGERAG